MTPGAQASTKRQKSDLDSEALVDWSGTNMYRTEKAAGGQVKIVKENMEKWFDGSWMHQYPLVKNTEGGGGIAELRVYGIDNNLIAHVMNGQVVTRV